MNRQTRFFYVLACLVSTGMISLNQAWAAEPDWTQGASVPREGRANVYQLPESEFDQTTRAGRLHALHYPVEVTGVLLPVRPIERFLAAESSNPLRRLIQQIAGGLNHLHNFTDLEDWLGLHRYPMDEGEGVYEIPFKDGIRPEHAMGLTLIETRRGTGFTISCAQCHSGELFGKTILGLTNRFPRANQFFEKGLKAAKLVNPSIFQWSSEATDGETEMFARALHSAQFVQAKSPVQIGLDTSLAQVALSLARRAPDAYASRVTPVVARQERLSTFVADSKPAVWWNVKYKNRWLSDGSVLSGNPILTNLLWNEIGRGTDLHKLESWMDQNAQEIRELTSAVFASQAPRWTDFFPAESFDIESAKRGEKLFVQTCARCHGTYEKAWNSPDASFLSPAQRLMTTRVLYHEHTPVIDVGTDPSRYVGMSSLEKLNDLEISRRNGIRIERQKGYVPPPLVGIWARWPYFHNNSVPSLCAVLTPTEQRPYHYWAREAREPGVDFDMDCNGYPLTDRPRGVPREYEFDTRRPGSSNRGHDRGIFIKDGVEIFSPADKRDLIRFLQTL